MSSGLSVELTELHLKQQQILDESKRFNVVVCGRRFGKDTLGGNLYAEMGIDGYPAAWFTPTYKMLTETFQLMSRTLKPVASRINGSEHRIELVTGGILDMWSLDSQDTARGRKYKRVIINEAGFIPNLMDAWNYVIRPALSDYEGDAWFLGTPKGHNGFWQMYNWGLDTSRPEWQAWQFSTWDNPYIKRSEIEAMRGEMPERVYQQELEAAFLDDGGGVFRNIKACFTGKPDVPENHQGHHLFLANDWGQTNDFTTLGVMCATCRREVETDRFNQVSWAIQRGRLAALANRWNVAGILPERNSIGSPNIEALIADGLPIMNGPDGKPGFETTATSKPQLIQSLVLTLEKKDCTFIQDPISIGEMEAYEEKRSLITGRPQYSAPEGMHDDCVIRAALEVWAAFSGANWWAL